MRTEKQIEELRKEAEKPEKKVYQEIKGFEVTFKDKLKTLSIDKLINTLKEHIDILYFIRQELKNRR